MSEKPNNRDLMLKVLGFDLESLDKAEPLDIINFKAIIRLNSKIPEAFNEWVKREIIYRQDSAE
jgi:hypothetical protein